MAPAQALRTALTWANGALAAAATAWIFVLMVLICADVIGLQVFRQPLYGVVELTAASIVAVVFAQLPHTLAQDRVTRADFLIGALHMSRPRLAAALELAFAVAGVVVFVLLVDALISPTLSSWQDGEYIGTQGLFTLPLWPIKVLIWIGVAMTMLEFAAQAIARGASVGLKASLLTLAVLAAVVALSWAVAEADPGRIALGTAAIGLLLVMILMGMHVPVAMMAVALLGVWFLRDNPGLAVRTLRSAATGTIAKFEFGVVPLFVLMGLLVDAA
ncbi:MAG: TRAP transporter small permease subunit, partial [Shimia sp.]